MALGVVLLLVAFATGTSVRSASVDGVTVPCPPALDLTWLPFNALGAGPAVSTAEPSSGARREATACRSATTPLRLATWSALLVGAVVGLGGWTALRERAAAGVLGRRDVVRGQGRH